MKHIYAVGAVCAVVYAAYAAGNRLGRANCREHVAAENQILHTQIIQKQGEINVEALHTGVADIRRILRAKYTIAE
ncbi:MAG: hypothetical protein K2L94_02740 [Alphaproteobacteria bacterium]|nr:hypothetical protein [Alphaproteobacteria bacterium]